MPMLGIMASSITGGLSTASYESIASATGTGASATITFSSIPQTYKALQIRGLFRTTTAGVGQGSLQIRANGDSSAIYSRHFLDNISPYGAASATLIVTSFGNVPLAGHTAGFMGAGIIDVQNYASTTQYKTFRYSTSLLIPASVLTNNIGSGSYQTTTAITSISLIDDSGGSWATTTQFALYGIKG